jgi:hypothetical protein
MARGVTVGTLAVADASGAGLSVGATSVAVATTVGLTGVSDGWVGSGVAATSVELATVGDG